MTRPDNGSSEQRTRGLLKRFLRADRWSVAVLGFLPLLVFALPALLGRTVLLGDDFTQNYPLRAFVGSQVRHGHLPLLNPYIWSGAPLLGGWNAGAAYPFTVLFVILPATAAWTLNLVITWWVAGIGSFAFLRASRLGSVASFLGALSFSFTGAMTAHVVHFGLVAGMSWAPLVLLGLLRLAQLSEPDRERSAKAVRSSRILWIVFLACVSAMVTLAGEPRAITSVAIVAVIYVVWRGFRAGRHALTYLTLVLGALVLAAALGAIQWLPGEEAVRSSQRAASSAYLFTSGSLPVKWLLLLVVPDLLGGSGSFGQPSFFASYNITEVTGYVGLLPLVASFALLGQLRWRRRLPEWIVFHLMALVGILLTLGNSIPLWHLLVHVPLFGSQRLQSRNVLIADMGFSFLLAFWADSWLERPAHVPNLLSNRAVERRTLIVASLPALVAVGTVVVGIAWGAGMLHWLGQVTLRAASEDGGLRLWYLPFGLLGAVGVALLVWGRRAGSRLRKGLVITFVVVDVVTFTLMTVVSVDSGGPSAPPPPNARTAASISSAANSPSPGGSVATPFTALSAKVFVGSGRFAIYDPDLIDANGLNVIGAPDLNVVDAVPSVQGYGSIVYGPYATATGTHQSTGLGQNILDPAALNNGAFDQLNTTVLFSPRDYFLVSSTRESATAQPGAGNRHVAAGQASAWYLGENLLVRSITIADMNAPRDIESGTTLGLLTAGGRRITTPPPSLVDAHTLRIDFAPPLAAVALTVQAGANAVDLAPPSITSADGTHYTADGQLQADVVPPRWTFRAIDGSFAVFADRFAQPSVSLHSIPTGHIGSAKHLQASIKVISGSSFSPSAVAVSSSRGVEVVRSEAEIPGWRATWHPAHGAQVALPVLKQGLVQAVDVPPGRGVLSWTYSPPGWTAGWLLTMIAVAALLLMLLYSSLLRLLSAPPRRPPPADG